jgi:hypothetical protein
MVKMFMSSIDGVSFLSQYGSFGPRQAKVVGYRDPDRLRIEQGGRGNGRARLVIAAALVSTMTPHHRHRLP